MKVLAYGEIMLRMEVLDNKLIHQVDKFQYVFTGTGLNVLAGLDNFGHTTSIMTTLPENNLGKAAKMHINKLGVSTQDAVLKGDYLGAYILEKGYGLRPSEVTYFDRGNSSFNSIKLKDQYLESVLMNIDLVHICGIALSTSLTSNNNLKNLVKVSTQLNKSIVFDFNYRSKLNEDYRLRKDYKEVLKHSDIVLGSERDIVDLLGHDVEDNFETLCRNFVNEYDIEVFAGTFKEHNNYQGFIFHRDVLTESQIYQDVDTYDPIGTGDAFAAGIIDGNIRNYSDSKTIEQATAFGVLAHTTYGDSPVADVQLIKDVIEGKYKKVKR